MDGIILSFQLFSRLPIKKNVDFSKENLNTALMFLPFLGLMIGLVTGLVVEFFHNKSELLGGAFGLLAYLILSGGLHLDGLSDMADGFLSNRDREKVLEIMKDSLIGAFGTLSLVVYCILKFSLYNSFSENIVLYFGVCSCISRISSLYVIQKGKLARPGGFGAAIKEGLDFSNKFLFLFILLGVLVFLNYKIIFVLLASILVSEIIIRTSYKKIGGVTGDIYGATIEINEIVCLLVYWGLTWI